MDANIDQYSDGLAAKVWEQYIGDVSQRTGQYRAWLTCLLRVKHCHTVLDVACGTGIDSIMLLEEGFKVTSVDASDKMLKYALRTRWQRRNEDAFDKWVIEEANWLTLPGDIRATNGACQSHYDAVICLGNSFAHLPDSDGTQENHKVALANFYRLVKPGGIMVVDHRNYDTILKKGVAPAQNVYYNSAHILGIEVTNQIVGGQVRQVTLEYSMDMSSKLDGNKSEKNSITRFSLTYYPHRLGPFIRLLRALFTPEATHEVYADFKPLKEVPEPGYYIHIIQKPQIDGNKRIVYRNS